MALLKDFLLELNNTFNNNELSALAGASSIAEVEVGDETVAEIKTKMGGLMSIDSAQNNADLDKFFKKKHYGAIKGEVLGNTDTDLMNSVKSIFGDEAVDQFKEIEFTGDKVKKFAELTKLQLENKDGGDEKIKTLNAGLNKQVADLSANLDKAAKNTEKEIEKLNSGFKEKLIKKEFRAAFNNYNLGDTYQKDFFKKSLHDKIFADVSKVAKLTLSENDEVVPKNPDNSDMELFVNNKPVSTLSEVLDPLMKDYIKVNNVDPNKKEGAYVPAKEVKLSTMAQQLQQRKKNQ